MNLKLSNFKKNQTIFIKKIIKIAKDSAINNIEDNDFINSLFKCIGMTIKLDDIYSSLSES